MELKQMQKASQTVVAGAFNRTFMELKLIFLFVCVVR